jgi:segregation and condensation protein B
MGNGLGGSGQEPDWAALVGAGQPAPESWPGPGPEAEPGSAAWLAREGSRETGEPRAGARPGDFAEPAADAELAAEDEPDLQMSLEAVLLVADEPVTEAQFAEITRQPPGTVSAVLRELSDSYTEQGRGFDLREVAGGWRLYTRAECAGVVERFVSDGQEIRLTQAALETLSVVAYRQPVSRARVSAVRGVNCDGVMRTLVLRGLVAEAGSDPETGAILFGTTGYFLERLGLARLEDLPDLVPFLPDHLDEELDGHVAG